MDWSSVYWYSWYYVRVQESHRYRISCHLFINMWMCCLWGLLCILEGGRGIVILTLCLFGIQYAYVHGLEVVFICAIFHVLCGRVCVVRLKWTISKMLCICYNQGSIELAVCAASFWFNCTRLLLIFLRLPLYCFCVVFPRPVEITNQIEVSRLICW